MNKHTRQHDTDAPMVYHIRLKGHVGSQWTDWLGGATLTREANGATLLTCSVVDQAALHGVLRKIRDSGLVLLSVMRVEPGPADAPDAEPGRETGRSDVSCPSRAPRWDASNEEKFP